MRYLNILINEIDLYLDYTVFSILAIYVLSCNSVEVGIMGACFTAPYFLFSKIIGGIADRCEIAKVRMISYLFMLLTMICSLYIGNVYLLCFIVFLKTIGRFGNSVTVSKMILPTEASTLFYEKYGYIVNSSRLITPIISILLYKNFGLYSLLYSSIFLNIIGVYFSFKMPFAKSSRSEEANILTKNVFKNSLFFKDRILVLVIGCFILSSVSLYLSNDLISFLFMRFGASESSIGILISILGLGGIIGVRSAKALLHKISTEKAMVFSLLINSFSFFLFGFASKNWPIPPLISFYAAMGFTGVASGILSVSFKSILQDRISYTSIGSATASVQSISSIVAITLPLLGGALANFTNIQIPFKLTSLFFAVVFTVSILFFNLSKTTFKIAS